MEDQHHLGQWITVKRNKQDEDIKIDSLIEKKKKRTTFDTPLRKKSLMKFILVWIKMSEHC